MTSNQTLITIPLLLILGVATLMDWRRRKIPNVLTFGAALFGLIMQITVNGAPGLLLGVGGWLVGLACLLPFYAMRGMAAGDVKLMAAAGAFLGPVAAAVACALTLIAGGVIALASVAWIWAARCAAGPSIAGRASLRDAFRTRIPYAGAIAAGTSAVVLVPSVIPPALAQLGI